MTKFGHEQYIAAWGETYGDVLDRDSRPVPEHFRSLPPVDFGDEGVPVTNYFDKRHFDAEVRSVWLKVWQWACREEDIPNPGDAFVYENVGKSVVIVRQTDGGFKAFYNSCLHRGRNLVDRGGHVQNLTCKYHGMSWKCDGGFRHNPLKADFPQFDGKDMSLPELLVDTWGGFVFVNFDPAAKPLAETLGPLITHFASYDYANRYTVAHVSKVIACNWKVVAEAFMEGHHVYLVHPQALPFVSDMNAQYDMLSDFVSRHLTATGVPSPMIASRKLSETAILEAMAKSGSRMVPGDDKCSAEQMSPTAPVALAEGETARRFAAELARKATSLEDNWDYSDSSDAEMLDSLLYNVFPHQCFWAGYIQSILYRFRPNGTDPESSIMDVLMLKRVPKDGARPKPATEVRLRDDQDWTLATSIGPLAQVIDQDMENMMRVQRGLKTSGSGVVHFSRYAEMRIRHMHHKIARMIAEGSAWKG